MNEKFYSEFIGEDFYKMISALRIVKGIKDFEEFVFLFVNSNDCESVFIEEKELTTKKINIKEFVSITHIVVLGYGHWKNGSYTNVRYSFIGIFDTEGKESTIDLGCIKLNSISMSTNGYCQIVDVSSCNITIQHNQFNEYLKQVTSPIYKMLCHSSRESGRNCYNFENKLTMDFSFDPRNRPGVWGFGFILKRLKEFEQELSRHLEETKFDPEISFKIKSSELTFDDNF